MNEPSKVNVTCCFRVLRNNPKMLVYVNEHIMSKYLYMQTKYAVSLHMTA